MFSDSEAWHLKKDTELALTSFPEGRMAPGVCPQCCSAEPYRYLQCSCWVES